MVSDIKQTKHGYTFNPVASVILERNPDESESFKIRAPIRNEHLRVSQIFHDAEPDLFGALIMRQIAQTKGWPHTFPEGLQSRLIELGLLVRNDQTSRPVRFDCDLNAELLEFVARRPHILLQEIPTADWIINPAMRFLGTSGSSLNNSILKSCIRQLRPDRFWYELNAECYGPGIYSFSESEHEILTAIIRGEEMPAALDRDWFRLLVQSEILVTPAHLEQTAASALRTFGSAKSHLHENRYIILKTILHPFQLAAIRRYYRAMVKEGYFSFGDEEWPLRFFAGNDLIARFYHEQLTALMCKIIGEVVRPTFTFFASYRPGAILPPHRDREECEFSISFLLDYVPEPEDLCSWPIFVESPKGSGQSIPVHLGIGDLLLYRGRELRHYRNAFQEGEVSTTWLFFYEPVDSKTMANDTGRTQGNS
jgi:hypothetical protein